jgi:TonB family protein
MLYLLQITVYSALLYAVYLLILKNRASHEWSRFYLLLCVSLPLIVPFIKIPAITANIPISAGALNIQLPGIYVFANSSMRTGSQYILGDLLIAVYALGALAMLARAIILYISFKRFVKHSKTEVINNVNVLLNTNTGPGSFQNYIFLPGDKIDPEIFDHELAHIRLKHSADILFIQLLQAIFWPNIALHLIRKELKIVHEFQADAYAVKNKEAYIATLLNDTFNTNQFALSHTFFYHPLKRRIMMLQKSPISRSKLRATMLKTGFSATILLAGIVYLQSCKQDTQKPGVATVQPKMTVYDTVSIGKTMGHREVLNIVEQMPEAPYSLKEFLAANLKYPDNARNAGIEGRVFIKFVVDENGNIVDPIVLRASDSTLGVEALRVVSSLPPWKPGKQNGKNIAVYFTLPIVFKLDDNTVGTKTLIDIARYLTIAPNPSKGSFTLKGATGEAGDEEVSVEISDLKGNVVYNKKTSTKDGILDVPVSLGNSIPHGMYSVNVQSHSLNKVLHVLIP